MSAVNAAPVRIADTAGKTGLREEAIGLRSFVAILACFFVFGGAAAAQDLLDHHVAAGVDCADCHAEKAPRDPGNAPCLACHGTMTAGPVPDHPDPHHSPHLAAEEAPDCTSCHRVHAPSEVTCRFCHRGFQFTLD
jgi:hypothetical protein